MIEYLYDASESEKNETIRWHHLSITSLMYENTIFKIKETNIDEINFLECKRNPRLPYKRL